MDDATKRRITVLESRAEDQKGTPEGRLCRKMADDLIARHSPKPEPEPDPGLDGPTLALPPAPAFDMEPIEPTYWKVDDETYHGDSSRLSHTALEEFRKKRPRYHAIYIARTVVRASTSAFDLGSAFHLLKLQPDEYDARVAIIPEKVDRRTKVGKIKWAEFLEVSKGKITLTAEDGDKLRAMLDALHANQDAVDLLEIEGGVNELAIAFCDPETGLPLKIKPDFQATSEVIADIKTSRSCRPEMFAKTAAQFGYHRQAALYCLGRRLLTGTEQQFFHVVVENDNPPYECGVIQICPDDIERAAEENQETMRALLECVETNDWRSPHVKHPQEIQLPPWAFSSAYDVA